MKIKNVRVYGLPESIIRSGYPMQIGEPEDLNYELDDVIDLEITDKELIRAKNLSNVVSGSGHDNFLKGIIVQFDLQYPEYFSPQLQRYNWVDVISSQSKMHRIMSKPLSKNDFTEYVLQETIDQLNVWIDNYINSEICNKKQMFESVMTNLPSGYLKWMGISTNYLQLKTIWNQRRHHKLEDWQYFCNWIETLPMAKELITVEK